MAHILSTNPSKHHCPVCKTTLTAATGVDTDAKPEAGDISICYKCGEILTFTTRLTHKKMSEEVLNAIKENDPETYDMITKISEMIKSKL